MTTIASSLASLEIQRVVDENASDLKQYGLEPARVEVAFRSKGQKELRRVQIGEKTPTGSDLYARLPDQKRVFLVSSFLDSTFNKNTFALRDRRILVFDRAMVDGLELTSGTSKTRLAKSGSDWRLASPISVRADFAAVEGALERLSSTQMQGIVDPEGKDLAKYGLTKPTGTITVNAGSSSATLTLGSTENALLFARDASRPLVFTVAPILKEDVIRTRCRLPAEGSLRRPRVHSHASRNQARRRDDRPREEQRAKTTWTSGERAARTSIRRRPTIC